MIHIRIRWACAAVAAVGLAGCSGGGAEPRGSAAPIVYFCTETKQFVTAAPQAVPAVNPQTGGRTLVRALHCPACRRWYPVPPPDVYPGNPLLYRCPRHKSIMSPNGPHPSTPPAAQP